MKTVGNTISLTLASQKDIDRYWGIAAAWADQVSWKYYQNQRFTQIKGIAEFLANQDGFTVYYSNVGQEYKKLCL